MKDYILLFIIFIILFIGYIILELTTLTPGINYNLIQQITNEIKIE